MVVAIGSTNPTKIKPVQDVFEYHFPDVVVRGVVVQSGVADQPKGDAEIYKGALNRARNAIAQVKVADYGVGIEGGIVTRVYGDFEFSLVVIVNKQGDIGVGTSGGLVLPKKVMDAIHSGKNLEEAIDALFGTTKIGRSIGMFGIMTNKVVTRADGVKHGIAFALARFLHADIYR